MRIALVATIWLALTGLVAGEAGLSRWRSMSRGPRWAWPVSCGGLLALGAHIVIAMGSHHHWSHQAALLDTARLTAAVYGIAWTGGLYVNYVFAGTWLARLVWWRAVDLGRPSWARVAWRVFALVIVFNAAVIFAPPQRRWAGLVITAGLLAAWRGPARVRHQT